MQLTPEQYLRAGSDSAWSVKDLLPEDSSRVRLIFVLESPHVEELDADLPVVGAAGRSAFRFLQGERWAGQSLGGFVVDKHAANDSRLAVLNVSTVPLQRQAFKRTAVPPDLAPQEWKWLGVTFRKSKAQTVDSTPYQKTNVVGRLLLDNLQERIDQLRLDPDCVVIACGLFAQRYVRQLHRLPEVVLRVPHPANNQWHTKKRPASKDLIRTRELFVAYTG